MRHSQKMWSLAAATALVLTASAHAGTDFTDDFESYNLGQLDGQGGWHGWGAVNTTFANVVNTQNHTGGGSQSAEIAAGADSVHEFTYSGGAWTITAWTFCPNTFVGKSYFIVLNAYDDLGPFQWSVQVGFNGDTQRLECDCGTGTIVQAPLVTNAWAVLQVDVDLDTGTTDVYYNTTTTAIATYQWDNGVFGTDNFGLPGAIDAIDLYPDAIGFPHVTPVFFDDISIESGGIPDVGTPVCFGDGTGAPCGCLNESDPGSGGCRNSVSGTQGALATATGTAGQDQTTNPLTFNVTNVRTQPGLFFSANNTIGGGTGSTFGDGLRCCGGGLVRVENINPPVGPEPVSVTTTATFTPAAPGTKRCYQYWYRDPGGPCGTNFNLSSAVTVTWGP